MNMNKKGTVWKREMWNREKEEILLMYKDEGGGGGREKILWHPEIPSSLFDVLVHN